MKHQMINTRCICLFLVLEMFISCARFKNHEEAHRVSKNGKQYIKLTGDRVYMPHHVSALFETYLDSILIPVPLLDTFLVKGDSLADDRGEMRNSGFMLVTGEDMDVRFLVYDVDEKRWVYWVWNGNYKLKK